MRRFSARVRCSDDRLASPKGVQAQLGHSEITTTLGIYTIPIPAQQPAAVEKLAQLVTDGDEFEADAETAVAQPGLLQ